MSDKPNRLTRDRLNFVADFMAAGLLAGETPERVQRLADKLIDEIERRLKEKKSFVVDLREWGWVEGRWQPLDEVPD